MLKHQGRGGTDESFPMRVISRGNAGSFDIHAPTLFQAFPNWYWYYEDFLDDALQSDEHFTLYDHSPAGSPTKAILANTAGGVLQLLCTNTSEAQTLAYTFNDNLLIQANLPWFFAARVKTVHTMAANQTVVVGVGSALNNDPVTPDWITRSAWFRQTASNSLLIEADDNTTDQTYTTSPAVTITAGDYYWYVIEMGADSRLYFTLITKDGYQQSWTLTGNLGGTDPAFGANNVQPIVLVNKASGVTTPEINIDAVIFGGLRP